MADTPSVDNAGGGADSAIADMKAVFDQAIEKSAEITKVTTGKSRAASAARGLVVVSCPRIPGR